MEPEDYGIEALWSALKRDRRTASCRWCGGADRGPRHGGGTRTFPCLGLCGGGRRHRCAAGGGGRGRAGRPGQDASQPCRNPGRELDTDDACRVFRLPGRRGIAALRRPVRRAPTGQAGAGVRHPDRGAAARVASFATTYGLGRAAVLYLTTRRAGNAFNAEAVAAEFRRAMAEATGAAKPDAMFSKDRASKGRTQG